MARAFFLTAVFFISVMGSASAASYGEDDSKTSPQQIGGLHFDMDEGVKIEQGPGGSVYVKSNREYMQEKFESIERRLNDHEERIEKMEAAASGTPEGESSKDASPANGGRRVLIT